MKNLILLICITLLTGCAAGNKYGYESTEMSIPFETENSKLFILLVEEERPYVLNGNKKSNFVGLQRGGFGNPFDVTTKSGKAMTDAMSSAISDGFKNAGYEIIVSKEKDIAQLVNMAITGGASRIIVLKVNDWKSDLYASITMHVDLNLSIYSSNGDLLAENSIKYIKSIGAALLGAQANSDVVTANFREQVKLLFEDEKIKQALNSEVEKTVLSDDSKKKCSVDQVLMMKNAQMSDSQIKAACEK